MYGLSEIHTTRPFGTPATYTGRGIVNCTLALDGRRRVGKDLATTINRIYQKRIEVHEVAFGEVGTYWLAFPSYSSEQARAILDILLPFFAANFGDPSLALNDRAEKVQTAFSDHSM